MKKSRMPRFITGYRKSIILASLALFVIIMGDMYANCSVVYGSPRCQLGWFFAIIALAVMVILHHLKKAKGK